jgi:hypothetical protein
MINKVLFLDIDGVLNANTGDRFNYISISTLNAVFKSIPYDIVISSSWRNIVPLDKLISLFKHHGLLANIVGITPDFKSIKSRGEEIASYLNDNIHVEYCVILDDYDDFDKLAEHFVFIDNSMGLIPDHIDDIKQRLAIKINRSVW